MAENRVFGLGRLRLPGQFRSRNEFSTTPVLRTLLSSGSDRLFIDPDRNVLVFRRTVGGVVYEATVPIGTVGHGQEVVVAARWTSREQELIRLDAEGNEEETPRWTLDVWVNGVKGEPTQSVEGVPGDFLYVGSNEGTEQLDSELLQIRAWRAVLTDDEVAAEIAAL